MSESVHSKSTAKKRRHYHKRLTRRKGDIQARKNSTESLRSDTRAVLVTGGLQVRKQGYILFRRTGNWKRKFAYLRNGQLHIINTSNVEKAKRALSERQQIRRSRVPKKDDPENDTSPLHELSELVIEIVDLKKIWYERRNSRHFDLVVRTRTKATRKSSKDDKHKSVHSRSSRFSRKTKANSFGGDLRNRFSLLAFASPTETRYHFKAFKGTDGDHWVQNILYELRNQATCVQKSIAVVEKQQVDCESTNERLDLLHRQNVDMWALAKGKISDETLMALKGFVTFLEDGIQETRPTMKTVGSVEEMDEGLSSSDVMEDTDDAQEAKIKKPTKSRFGVSLFSKNSKRHSADYVTGADGVINESPSNVTRAIAEEKRKEKYERLEELRNWRGLQGHLKELLSEGTRTVENPSCVKTGLDELQILNDPQFHNVNGQFATSPKILKEHHSNWSNFSLRKKRVSRSAPSEIDIKDIQISFSNDDKEVAPNAEQVDIMFKSAVDIKARKDQNTLLRRLQQQEKRDNEASEHSKEL